MSALALAIALIAILTARPTPTPSFSANVATGHAIVQPDFIGWGWSCSDDDDETCYGGLQLSPDGMDEPTFSWVLTTGP